MSAHPGWFGEDGHRRFGWLHIPESREARAGVVLVPALGVEELSSHGANRQLALDLERAGFAALRFDYRATGDSEGNLCSVGLDDWIGDIRVAISTLRGLGLSKIAVVGLRVGALLSVAACALERDVDSLVLWDPVTSGRSFLRQQRALLQLSIGESASAGDTGTELLGMLIPPDLAAELSAYRVDDQLQGEGPAVLVLHRAGIAVDPHLLAGLDRADLEVEAIEGQDEFLDVLPNESVVPLETLARIVSFLDARLPERCVPVGQARPLPSVVISSDEERPVSEKTVMLGEPSLFGIWTESDEQHLTNPDLPVVVFLNAGLLHHVGPSRLWVELSRSLASFGFRSLRVDLSGLGDSGTRSGQPRQNAHAPDAIDDLSIIASQIAPDDPSNIIYVGLCSGGYHAVEAGIELGSKGALLINPILSFTPPEVYQSGTLDPRRRAIAPYNTVIDSLRRIAWLRDFAERHVPRRVWWLLDRLHIQPSPARPLYELVDNGTTVMLICGGVEALAFTHRAAIDLRRLERSGLVFEQLDSIDHTLFGVETRERARALLVDQLRASFVPQAATHRAPAAA